VVSLFSRKSLTLLPPHVRFLGLNAPNSILPGAPPQTPRRSLQCSRGPYSWILGGYFYGEEGMEGKGKGGEGGRGKKERRMEGWKYSSTT